MNVVKTKIVLLSFLAAVVTCRAQGIKISELPAVANSLNKTDVLPIVHDGATRKVTIGQIKTGVQGGYGAYDTLNVTRADIAIMHLDTGSLTPGVPLTVDSNGLVVSGNGGGCSCLSLNGLHEEGDSIKLGGELNEVTSIYDYYSSGGYKKELNTNTIAGVFNAIGFQTHNQSYGSSTMICAGDFTGVGMAKQSVGVGYLDLTNDINALMLIQGDSGVMPSMSLQTQYGSGQPQGKLELTNSGLELSYRDGSDKYGIGVVGNTTKLYCQATTYTLPNSDGTSGQFLTTDGSANLFWSSGGGGGAPSGGFMAVQMDNGDGTFYGNNQRLYWDTTYLSLFVGNTAYQINPFGYGSTAVYSEYLNTEQISISNDLESSGGGWVGLKTNPSTGLFGSYSLTLPESLPSANGTSSRGYLTSNYAGYLTWDESVPFEFVATIVQTGDSAPRIVNVLKNTFPGADFSFTRSSLGVYRVIDLNGTNPFTIDKTVYSVTGVSDEGGLISYGDIPPTTSALTFTTYINGGGVTEGNELKAGSSITIRVYP